MIDLDEYGYIAQVGHIPEYKWELVIGDYCGQAAMTISSPTRPNRWLRFWHKALLGWVWRELE